MFPASPRLGRGRGCWARSRRRRDSICRGWRRRRLRRGIHAIRCCEGSPGPQDVSWQWRHPRRCRDAPSGVDVGCNSGNHAAWQGLPRHHGPWAGHLAWLGGVRRWHLVVQQRVGGWHHAGRPRVLMHLLRGLPVLLLHLLSSPQLSVFQLLHVEVLTFRE